MPDFFAPQAWVGGAWRRDVLLAADFAEKFLVPDEVRAVFAGQLVGQREARLAWEGRFEEYRRRFPELAALVRSFAPPAAHAAVARLVGDPDVQRARDEALRSTLPVKLRLRFEQHVGGEAARR